MDAVVAYILDNTRTHTHTHSRTYAYLYLTRVQIFEYDKKNKKIIYVLRYIRV